MLQKYYNKLTTKIYSG